MADNKKTPARLELEKQYRALAKKADQRLVRLEKYSQDEHYKGITKFAYASAMEDIKHYSGENAKRFNTKPPESTLALKGKIARIQAFLEAPTSTKAGVTKIYQQRAATIRKNNPGSKITWQELANYWEKVRDGAFVYTQQNFKAALSIREEHKAIADNIKAVADTNKKINDDEVQQEIKQQLLDQGLDYDALFTSKPVKKVKGKKKNGNTARNRKSKA